MLPKVFRGLRLTALVPLFAGVVGLVAVGQASALHAPKRHAHVLKPQIRRDGLNYVGLSVSTLLDANGSPAGLLVQGVVPGSLTDASGLELGDVIEDVNGAPTGTSADFDAIITNAISPSSGQTSLPLMVIDTRDPNAGPQPITLPLQ